MTADGSGRLSPRGLVVLGFLGAITFVAKMCLAAVPNIEPVSLLVIVCTVVYGLRSLYPIYVYVFLECLVWGINLWTVNYLYIWLLLALAARLLRRMESPLGWAILSGTFGLCFGALCAPVYLLSGGWAFALSWWVSGLPFDLLHCGGNFAIALVLFRPCRNILTKLNRESGLTR